MALGPGGFQEMNRDRQWLAILARAALRIGLLAAVSLAGAGAQSPQIGGCPVFPPDNIWNVPIDNLPVDRNSARYIESGGPSRSLHPDFGKGGAIPFSIVPSTQPKVPVILGSSESDPGPYPIPPNAPVEPGPAGSDKHVLVLEQETCKLYEIYAASPQADGSWKGGSGAVFDLRSHGLRPDGWTSADAAGLPILAGLVRFDEVASGEIRHALRLTMPGTRRAYVWPARHFASRSDDIKFPPMGQRFRLKADYDISGFPKEIQVILRALKKYGLMLADNGQSWFITGAPDPRWDDEVLNQLKRVKGSDLEAVDVSSLMVNPNSGLARWPNSPSRNVVEFSATPVFDFSAGMVQTITLKGDVVSSTLASLIDGQTVSFLICQDEQGGRKFTWPSNVLGGMNIGIAPGKCSAQQFVSDGTKLYATSPGVKDM
jgi:hypothetical protein